MGTQKFITSIIKLNFIFIFILLVACEKKDIFKVEGLTAVDVGHFPKDILLPSIVWDLLEGKSSITSAGKIQYQEVTHLKFEENVFVGAKVRMIEKSPGVLGGQSVEVTSTRAGLHIDLSQYVKMSKGTFLMSFKPDSDVKPEQIKVYFVSRSRKRKALLGQNIGSGCNTFYDITDFYLKKILKEGIEVNVTNNRHVSLLAGHFIMLVSHEGVIRAMTQITFTDTAHPNYLCEKVEDVHPEVEE